MDSIMTFLNSNILTIQITGAGLIKMALVAVIFAMALIVGAIIQNQSQQNLQEKYGGQDMFGIE